MANEFSKEERVAFEKVLEGSEDALVISRNVAKFGTDGQLMERTNDTIWRPSPYILSSQDRVVGTEISFQDVAQLSVPATLGYKKSVPWKMDALELRDALQEGKLGAAASQRLASDVNTAVRDVASLQGTICVAITGAAGDYDDIALCESAMNEQGIPEMDRYLALSTRDYNGLAGNLASRQTMTGKPQTAYERSLVGMVAGFETYKMDAGKRITANSATVTMDTTGSQVQYVPVSTRTAATGEVSNVDNRYQTITVSTTSGVTAGDMFTIAGVESVHHIHKESTGELKTFRVISVDTGTTMTISPPIIGANQASPTDAELAYKNVEITATGATQSLVFLNDTAAAINPFWVKDSIEILPGRYAVPTDQGPAVMRATTDQGLEVVMTKTFNTRTFVSEFSLDVLFGVVNTNPEMNGALIFGQS